MRTGWPALVLSAAARLVLGVPGVLVAVSVLLPLVTSWQSSVVLSGSMSPTLQPGDVVVVRPVDAASLEPGDVVLVDDPDVPGELRLHRLVALEDGALRLRGDASATADTSLVPPAAVHGVGTLRLPALGLPALWAHEGRTALLLLTGAGLAGLLALAFLHPPEEDGEPRRRRVSPRPLALGAAVVVLAGLPGAADARAVFSSTTATPANSFTASSSWTCTSAAQSASAQYHYAMAETAGTTATNTGTLGAAANGTYSSTGVTYGVAGPRCGTTAVRLNGTSGALWTTRAVTNPQTFSLQVWFNTTTTTGGLLMGFGSGANGTLSADYDRHVVMTDAGRLAFGVYDGSATDEITSPAAYNDGRWHLTTATFSGTAGMTLYVDGVQVARDATATVAQNFTGYWRVGYDNIDTWGSTPTSRYFAGSLASAAVFPSVLSATEVANQYGAGPWTCATAAGTSGAGAIQYFGLQETGGTTAANGGSAGTAGNGTYASAGVTYGVAGPSCGPGGGSAVRLDGASGMVWTTKQYTAPQNLTVQIWFSTTTTRGGKLIGFGSAANGAQSTQFDRHVYMTNDGRIAFGIYNGGYYTVTSTTAFNDGKWHLVTASFSPGTGLALYVDATLIGTSTQTTAAENTVGYWRIGFDNLGSWPNAPTSNWFAGSVAHAAVFDRVLTADEVAGQYAAAG